METIETNQKARIDSMNKRNEKKLPAHLEAIIAKKEAEMKKLGLDPEWHKKALEAAEKRGDDNALIHAVI